MEKSIIYLISDSLGETAEHVINATLLQFELDDNYIVHRSPYVKDRREIEQILIQANKDDALVGYTLVDQNLRSYVQLKSKELKIESIDIIGPMLDGMARLFKQPPMMRPGLNHQLNESYFKRIEAIEFAVKYDDGKDPRGIEQADIVLIGVSRTSKTPLAQYLALKSLKVANVPMVPEVDPPKELFNTDPSKCYGLKISPRKLNEIRKERLKSLGLRSNANYATFDRIDQELEHFDSVIDRLGCPVLDVSDKAVEETASLILQIHMSR